MRMEYRPSAFGMFLLLAAALACLPKPIPGQSTAGGPSTWAAPAPDGRLLRPGVETLTVYLVREGKRERTAYVIDALHIEATADGDTLIRRTYEWVGEGARVDTIVDQRATLSPRRYYSSVPAGGAHTLSWNAGRLVGSVRRLGATIAIDTTLTSTVFNAATLDLILRASPLAPGYSVEVPSFIAELGIVPIRARVTATDTVPNEGVLYRVQANFAGLPVTFWIDPVTRRLVRQVFSPGRGARLEFVPTSRRGG